MSILVLGSANLDLVYRTPRIPRPGETLLAHGSEKHPGGKGANQAVAAARSGAPVTFLGALGDDEAGEILAGVLSDAGIRSLVRRVPGPSGTALIVVDDEAANTIVVDGAANAQFLTLTAAERDAIADASWLLMQLESPVETVRAAASHARAVGTLVAVNVSPQQAVDAEFAALIDLVLVNEHEAALFAGLPSAEGVEPEELAAAVLELAPAVVVTLGAAGSVVALRGGGARRVDAFPVTAVDTTGAGDTYAGALLAALDLAAASTAERSLPDLDALAAAARFAAGASALAVQTPGAIPAIPERARTEAFLRDRTP